MLFHFDEELKGDLRIRAVGDMVTHAAYLTLMGALRLGDETKLVQRQFDQAVRLGCRTVVFNLEGLTEVAPAGIEQLIAFKANGQALGIHAHVAQLPKRAELWVLIGLCAAYGDRELG
jgi:hypothetical protein